MGTTCTFAKFCPSLSPLVIFTNRTGTDHRLRRDGSWVFEPPAKIYSFEFLPYILGEYLETMFKSKSDARYGFKPPLTRK